MQPKIKNRKLFGFLVPVDLRKISIPDYMKLNATDKLKCTVLSNKQLKENIVKSERTSAIRNPFCNSRSLNWLASMFLE